MNVTRDAALVHDLHLLAEALANNENYNAPLHFVFLVHCAQKQIEAHQVETAALDKILAAVRAYMPPDGLTKEQLIDAVIEAVDNPEFSKAMGAK